MNKLHKNDESCTKINRFAQKWLLEFNNHLWHKSYVPIYIERFLLPILATIAVSVIILNPIGMDTTQKVTLSATVLLFAFFLAYTLHKYNESKSEPAKTTTAISKIKSNNDIKKQANELSREMLRFFADKQASEPRFNNPLLGEKNPDSKAARKRYDVAKERFDQEYGAYLQTARDEFLENFAVRYETTLRELKKRGADVKTNDEIEFNSTNIITLKKIVIRLGVIANELPDTTEVKIEEGANTP
jgi:hypothetical protein